MSNQTLTEQFAQYLKEDGKRLPTIQSYAGDVNGFLTYLQQMGTGFDGNLKRFHITSYRNRLVEDGYEASTVNKKINSLQAFNRWLIDRGMTVDAVVDLRKDRVKTAAGSEKQVEVFSEKQPERLLFCIQGEANTRDRAIVLTLLYTGIRVSELCEIKLRYLDFLINHLKIVGKGGKVREVPLKPEVTEGIKAYLPDRADSKYAQSENLFLGQRGPLQRDAVNTLLERLADKAGLDVRLKPHTFRHTFCTRLVKKGVPLPVISKLAGHSSIETTARFYLSTSKEDKIQAVSVL